MSKDGIKLLQNHLHDLISNNSVFSTSHNHQVARIYSRESELTQSHNLERVFFQIDANGQLANLKPFADIKYDPNAIWNIHLTLCSDDDHQLRSLLRHMNENLGKKEMTLLHFGHVLKHMGKLDIAQTYYSYYLQQIHPRFYSLKSWAYHALGTIANLKGDLQTSLQFHRQSLLIAKQTLSRNHPQLATIYYNLGEIYRNYTRALDSFYKSLDIFQEIYGYEHSHVANCFNNIGIVCKNKKNYAEALEWYEQATKIREKILPNHHPDLGQSYNNIGTVYRCLGKDDLALKYLNRSLRIKLRSLPSQHTDIASTLANIDLIHEQRQKLSSALDCFRKALKIYRHSFTSTHPSVIKVQNIIQRINSKPF